MFMYNADRVSEIEKELGTLDTARTDAQAKYDEAMNTDSPNVTMQASARIELGRISDRIAQLESEKEERLSFKPMNSRAERENFLNLAFCAKDVEKIPEEVRSHVMVTDEETNQTGISLKRWHEYVRGNDGELAKHYRETRNPLMFNTFSSAQQAASPVDAEDPVQRLKRYGTLFELASIQSDTVGREVRVPTYDDTGTTGVVIADDGSTPAKQDASQPGLITLRAKTIGSGVMKPTHVLLTDSAIDIASHYIRIGITRVGRKIDSDGATATGAAGGTNDTWRGWQTAAKNSGVTAASQTVLTAKEMMKLPATIDEAYLSGPEVEESRFRVANFPAARGTGFVGYVISRPQMAYLVGEVGADNPIFDTGPYSLGERRRLIDGWPIMTSTQVAAPAAGVKSCYFGNFSGQRIRMVGDLMVFTEDATFQHFGRNLMVAQRCDVRPVVQTEESWVYATQAA